MTDESYYKYWALVGLRDHDLRRTWGKSAYKESMRDLALNRGKR